MVRGSIPWGRMGTPEEVADLAVYLVVAATCAIGLGDGRVRTPSMGASIVACGMR
jgi:NAD(P)-dependent dehydrogenase (short-subunit alcohol dehydrogenase family)